MNREAMEVREVSPGYALKVAEPVVPEGYKQTEVGIIPEDWVVWSVNEFCQIKTGPFGTLLKASEYSRADGVPLISVGEIGAGRFKVTEKTPLVSEEVTHRLPQYVLKTGDIVFGRKGAVDRSALVTEGENGWFLGSDGIAVRPRQQGCSAYLGFQFQRSESQSWLLQNATGTTMASLSQAVLGRLNVPIAPDSEQRAIATALSDVDALLEELDRLVAKKRDIKQATMQQLLTGQTRLPGFEGEWAYKRIGEIFSIQLAASKSRFLIEGGSYLVVDMGSVARNGRLIASKTTEKSKDLLAFGDLIMPKDDIGGGNIIGRVAFIDADESYVLGDHVYALRSLEGNSKFFSYMINHHEINRSLRSKVAGSAQLGLSRKAVEEQEIPVPTMGEQVAIAKILCDMDAEIETLEQRRAKTSSLKQAMMQELLTGRCRLTSESENGYRREG